MPISQATILAIYGDLCDLVEKLETLENQLNQPGLWPELTAQEGRFTDLVESVVRAGKDAQRQAIVHIMADDRTIVPNPITGRLDE